jgi:hypothetical protein
MRFKNSDLSSMLDCWCNNLRWKIKENDFLIAYSSVKRNRFVFKFTESNVYLCAAHIPCENLEFKCRMLLRFSKYFFILK